MKNVLLHRFNSSVQQLCLFQRGEVGTNATRMGGGTRDGVGHVVQVRLPRNFRGPRQFRKLKIAVSPFSSKRTAAPSTRPPSASRRSAQRGERMTQKKAVQDCRSCALVLRGLECQCSLGARVGRRRIDRGRQRPLDAEPPARSNLPTKSSPRIRKRSPKMSIGAANRRLAGDDATRPFPIAARDVCSVVHFCAFFKGRMLEQGQHLWVGHT